MLACPSCPAPTAGAPFIQLDHRIACWVTDTLSAAALRAWLRLLTYFRNDRPIPQLSRRRLAQITGLSTGAAQKVMLELQQLLIFSGPGDLAGAAAREAPAAGELSEPPGAQRAEHPLGVHNVNAGRSHRERKRSHREQKRSRREHPTISPQEEDQEGKNPPPTSSTAPQATSPAERSNDEEEATEGSTLPPIPKAPITKAPGPAPGRTLEQPLLVDSRLQPVAPELLTYWAGKRGSRSALAFAAQQAELLRILASPIGGIEEVREQISTAALKDWDLIRHQVWHSWRMARPRPLQLLEEDLNEGALFPGLKAFERRYRATYGQHASPADVLVAFHRLKARLAREQELLQLQQPHPHQPAQDSSRPTPTAD